MKFGLAGISHKSAPIGLRERLAFGGDEIQKALRMVRDAAALSEYMILSTCNRVEVYAVPGKAGGTAEAALRVMARMKGVPWDEMNGAVYVMSDEAAVVHAIEVAVSLDSMILGEAEILGQMKDAYRIARETGAAGPAISRLMERVFHVAKELRSTTCVGRGSASVASAAVALAARIFENLKGRHALVFGTGAMAAGIVRGILAQGATRISVSSRTIERARLFCEEAGFGEPCDRKSGLERLRDADIVLSSCEDPEPVIRVSDAADAMRRRGGRPILIVDISVPRSVDPAANEIEGVFLYDIDDLQSVAESVRQERSRAAEDCRDEIRRRAAVIFRELDAMRSGDVSRLLMEKARSIQREELERAMARMGGMSPRAQEEIRRLAARISARIIHPPLASLRRLALEGKGEESAAWARELFDLSHDAADKDRAGGGEKSGNTGRPGERRDAAPGA